MAPVAGEVSIIERLITTARDITVVVVDTKAIPAERPAPGSSRPVWKSRRSDPDKASLSAETSAALFKTGVLIWDTPIEKEQVVRQLLELCCREKKELLQPAWEALSEREEQGGTYVGEEVAIPHARIAELNKAVIGLGVCRSGIVDAASGHPVHIMILLLSPAEPSQHHIAMLGVVSRMARDDTWRKEVAAAERPAEVLGAIHRWMERWRRS